MIHNTHHPKFGGLFLDTRQTGFTIYDASGSDNGQRIDLNYNQLAGLLEIAKLVELSIEGNAPGSGPKVTDTMVGPKFFGELPNDGRIHLHVVKARAPKPDEPAVAFTIRPFTEAMETALAGDSLPKFPDIGCPHQHGPGDGCGFTEAGIGLQCTEGQACGHYLPPGDPKHAEVDAYHRAMRKLEIDGAHMAQTYDTEVVFTAEPPDDANPWPTSSELPRGWRVAVSDDPGDGRGELFTVENALGAEVTAVHDEREEAIAEAQAWIASMHPELASIAPEIGVLVLLLTDNDVWLAERMDFNRPFFGAYASPGGSIEPGETPHQAARRELREETGLDLAYPRLKYGGLTEHTHDDGRPRPFKMHWYYARLEKHEIPVRTEPNKQGAWRRHNYHRYLPAGVTPGTEAAIEGFASMRLGPARARQLPEKEDDPSWWSILQFTEMPASWDAVNSRYSALTRALNNARDAAREHFGA